MSVSFSSHPKTSVRAEIRPGLWLDSRRVLWIAEPRLLVVADLHWGYSASHRARGHLVPVWGDDVIEQTLNAVLAEYQPAEMIWLGDVVHAAEGADRAERFLRTTTVPVTLIAGNHDRRWRQVAEKTATRGDCFFHHGDGQPAVPKSALEIVGHHHPAVSWADGAGARLKLPALVATPRRLVLPAFSPWAAGAAWSASTSGDETLWVVAASRIFALPRSRPAPSPAFVS